MMRWLVLISLLACAAPRTVLEPDAIDCNKTAAMGLIPQVALILNSKPIDSAVWVDQLNLIKATRGDALLCAVEVTVRAFLPHAIAFENSMTTESTQVLAAQRGIAYLAISGRRPVFP